VIAVRDVPGDVGEVVGRLISVLRERGVEVSATIDHGAGARGAGLELDDEVVVVFGDPAVGTALMRADPRCGLDLPLRMVVWSQGGVVRVAYQDPAELTVRYDVAAEQPTLDWMGRRLEWLATELEH